MSKQFNKVKLSVTIDEEIYEVVKKMAEADDRAVSSMINKILKEYVAEKG